jgi:hypothetical protein
MTTLREAAQQALETLEALSASENILWVQKRAEIEVEHLRAALAQEEHEPVAVHQFREANSAVWYDGHADHDDGNGPYEERVLYTAPPRREWQGLTDEEIWELSMHSRLQFARDIEQALKERNHG